MEECVDCDVCRARYNTLRKRQQGTRLKVQELSNLDPVKDYQDIKETVLFGNLFTFLCFNSVFGSKIPLNIFSFFYLMLHVNLLICCMIFSVVTLCMNVWT